MLRRKKISRKEKETTKQNQNQKNELALLNEKKTGGGACRSRAKPSMAV